MSDENLYAQLTERWSMQVEMPFHTRDGSKIVLPMVILSGRELYEAKQKAEADTRLSYGKDVPKKDEISEWDQKFNDQLAYWTIFYSVRQPDKTKRFFPTKESVMDALTADEAGILSNHYMTVQLNQPCLIHLDNDDPEKIEVLIEKIIKDAKDPHFFLNSLTSHAQNTLINFMGVKLAKLQTDNGLHTMSQDDSTTSNVTQNHTNDDDL